MRHWKGFLTVLAVVGLAGTAAGAPAVGVFFDEGATQPYATFSGGMDVYHTAYVCAVDLDMILGGMAFKLQIDPRIHVMSAEYPNAIKLGEPTDGVQIGFERCRPAWGGAAVVGCVLTLWTGAEKMTNAEIRVVSHPTEGAIMLADCDAILQAVSGLTSFLTVSVGADETTWGAVKGLYQ